jgi:hypothetical protein
MGRSGKSGEVEEVEKVKVKSAQGTEVSVK